uniref:histidine kinase n=1 Tax=Magnetococcus massalia (strain MO-1) TaxID=451514 RepID=A0A1S7LDV8_MAGMO|nr:Putative histidine kinase with PAS 4 domain and response regulator receiver domain [Candidatus Magnetococcus massalia]
MLRTLLDRFSILAVLIWTVLIGASLSWMFHTIDKDAREQGILTAQASYHKDTAFRFWASSHGGVYVPVTERTTPSPYLSHIDERDITTPSGRELTLMNPAYMLRQMMNEYSGLYGLKGRITSLQVLNPINEPDPWEERVLKEFEGGLKEKMEFVEVDGEPYLRLMKPLAVKESCLKCHGFQGYVVGSVRGGIGVKLPMGPIYAKAEVLSQQALTTHAIIWFVGVVVIGLIAHWRQGHLAEREVYEATLRRYGHIMNVMHDHISFVDTDYVYREVNNSYLRVYQLEREQIVGHTVQQLLGAELFARVKPRLDRCLAGEPVTFGQWTDFPDGSRSWMDVRYEPYRNARGEVTGLVVSSRDSTMLKETELSLEDARHKAESASHAKSIFLASMSHEIRTPLNVILGMGELLADSHTNSSQAWCINTLNRSGEALLSLINDILDLAKIEEGKLQLEEVPFDLHGLLDETVHLYALAASDKDVQFKQEKSRRLPRWVKGDPTRVRQVLLNLISNALKFIQQGKVILRATAQEGEMVLFEVMDTGPGIPQEKQQEIFKPFVQADASTTREHGGTGLGLAICQHLIAEMGGAMGLKSELGKGATFSFNLPLPEMPHEDRSQFEAQPAPICLELEGKVERSSKQDLDILLVDDSMDNRLLVQAFLKKTAHRITMAENGHEAVEQFKAETFDVVLMDIQMPVMDGYEATRQIRAWEQAQGYSSTPIIALTAHALVEEAEQIIEAGCDLHLTKPVRRGQLLEVLSCLHAKQSEQVE